VSSRLSVYCSYLDVSAKPSWWIAMSLPARSAPSAIRCTVCGRYPVATKACRRVSTSFTGRPT
jgi:hypothetical protein